MNETKTFGEVKQGEFLFCATQYGKVFASIVDKVEVGKKIVKIYHAFNGGEQRFPINASSKDCGGFNRYVATTKEGLIHIMENGVRDYLQEIKSKQDCLNNLLSRKKELETMTEEEIINRNTTFTE